ncbi:MAG: DUF58 domain-containing protein [Pseudomonadota bacterium]
MSAATDAGAGRIVTHDPSLVSQPELIRLRDAARHLSLDALRIRARRGGNYLSHFKGRGMEFDEARLYQDGDDPRNIDWRLTARTGRAYTKLFREERERPVFCWVDQRPTMQFATRGVFKSVQAARLAALLGWAAVQRGDRLGGFVFNGEQHAELRPLLGHRAALRLIHQMAAMQSSFDAPNSDTGVVERTLAGLHRVAHPGSLIALASDFTGMTEKASAHLVSIARHNDVLVLFISDGLERELPPAGRYPLSIAGRRLVIDTTGKRRRDWIARFEARRDALGELCERSRVSFQEVATDDDPLEVMQGLMGRVGVGATSRMTR